MSAEAPDTWVEADEASHHSGDENTRQVREAAGIACMQAFLQSYVFKSFVENFL